MVFISVDLPALGLPIIDILLKISFSTYVLDEPTLDIFSFNSFKPILFFADITNTSFIPNS